MASIPRSRVSPVGGAEGPSGDVATLRETRARQISRGVKYGLVKGTVDQVLDQIAVPLADLIIPRLHELHPGLHVADAAVMSLVKFAVLNIVAEVLAFGGPQIAKVPGIKMSVEDATKKTAALADWMRNYSGEMVGEQLAETAAKLIPLVAGMLSEVDLSSLLNAAQDIEAPEEAVVDAQHHALFQNAAGRRIEGEG